MSSGEVAYVECLQAQEALYWWARQRGLRLDDKTIGDMLRIAAPYLRACESARGNLPVGSTYDVVATMLRNLSELVASGDSYEGSIEWTMPVMPEHETHDEQPEVMVRAVFRVGNTQGQGGVQIIGTMGRQADAKRDDDD